MVKEFDVAVIGSGPGGYVAAIRAAQLGLKTACIEKDPTLGGTCLNVGCIPSKALLHTTELLQKVAEQSEGQGIASQGLHIDFEKMMARKCDVVKGLTGGIAGLFKKNLVTWIQGTARLKDGHTIQVQGAEGIEEIRAASIILAAGSEPVPLPFLPFDEQKIVSSTGALSLAKIPKKMLVVGAGAIGLELGSVYRRIGCEVTVVEFLDRVCPLFDAALSKALQQALAKQGLSFMLSSKVTAGQVSATNGATLTVESKAGESSIHTADVVLVSIGRRPYSKDLGLSDVGIQLDSKGFVKIDGCFRTSVPSVYAIGDMVEGPMLAHKASEEGVVVAELIAGSKPHINYMSIPNVIYTFPEVAAVGMTEEEAKAAGLSIITGSFPFKANSRARCTGEDTGFVKVVADQATHRLLGMHIIGANASELIAEGVLAIEKRATVDEIANTSHAHPTLSEAVKEACLSALKRPIHI